jgi:hypothetical protein
VTDPAWEQMLIARAETHIGELYREIASMGMVTTTWQEARDMANRLAGEYAVRIVRDLLAQMNEGTRPAHVHTGFCNHGTCDEYGEAT